MKIKFVYKVLPVLVFYTDNLDPKWGGYCYGPVVKIRKKYENDEGLLQHELVHSKQFYRTLTLHGIAYKLFETYRVHSEVEAYKKQASYYQDKEVSYQWMADAILQKYDVKGFTKTEVLDLLRNLR